MTDLNYTNAAIAAGFTAKNDVGGKFMFFTDKKRIIYRDNRWLCFDSRGFLLDEYKTLPEVIEAEKE